MDLDDDEDGEVVGTSRILQRKKPEEKKLLCECWVKISKNNDIRANQSDNTFWWKVTHAFNKNECALGINHLPRIMITDSVEPVNPVDLIELFGDDARPYPPTNGTQWNQIENDRRAQFGDETLKQKDLAILECKEL
ncbi:hypothetical protein Tco_0768630 [Tanacetum coccineum]